MKKLPAFKSGFDWRAGYVAYPRSEYIRTTDAEYRREIWPQAERCWINGRLVNSIVYKRAKDSWKYKRHHPRPRGD